VTEIRPKAGPRPEADTRPDLGPTTDPEAVETSAALDPTDPTDRPRMPVGLRLFLVYALLILAGIGLSLRFVIDQAISAPVSLPGVVVMILLAYTIFTTTLVLQRKQAAFGLAVGLASLIIPLVLLLLVSPVHPALPVFAAAFGLLLFRGLLRPEVRAYLSEA
jgi:FtsH-binding integral membrane protein